MYRVWYSTESFANWLIDNTDLANLNPEMNYLYESDASKPRQFHSMPDHIRKILYLDSPDIIVEWNSEPIFSIEYSNMAGTGHNVFQRFARIAASAENGVPAFYIYPAGVIVTRKDSNPLIFKALEKVMEIHETPALFHYFPSDYEEYKNNPEQSPHLGTKGIVYDIDYLACPKSDDKNMQTMFKSINTILKETKIYGVTDGIKSLLKKRPFMEYREFMSNEYTRLSPYKGPIEWSPNTATIEMPTEYLLNYLAKYENDDYRIGELLRKREYTVLYIMDAFFRGDPYAGALVGVDYLRCREGNSYEERDKNLVMVWGEVLLDHDNKTIIIESNKASINQFMNEVKNCAQHNLLVREYYQLKNYEIPRYFMQVRYGSTYSKVKHVRVISYFADALLFPDGSLWRDG